MAPQEKAEELFMMYVNKGMNQIKPVINRVIRKEMAKQCALIAVDEIIRVLQDEQDWYWPEVKEELEKL
jgi:replication-associated recombination protein RarA